MQFQTLDDVFVDQLGDLLDAERQLVDALPKMAAAASDDKLRKAFEEHLAETHDHVHRLEEIFGTLGRTAPAETCKAMKGLVAEGTEVIQSTGDPAAKDAALIAAAQRVEHYEIAGYGTARTHAHMLGLTKVAKLLQQTLDEEAATDKKLTQLAESVVNQEALQNA